MAAVGTMAGMLPAETRDDEAFNLATLAHPHLLDILRDEEVVHALGQRYRETVPDENNAYALAQAIGEEPRALSHAALSARMKDRVQRDFAEGRTVTLNGWILSLTEARQCALYSFFGA
jgi:hypothetical protein